MDYEKLLDRILELGAQMLMAGAETVSYTHLDVYKRQVQYLQPFPASGSEKMRPVSHSGA